MALLIYCVQSDASPDTVNQPLAKKYRTELTIVLDGSKPSSDTINYVYPTYEEFYGEEGEVKVIFSRDEHGNLLFDDQASEYPDEHLYWLAQDLIESRLQKDTVFNQGRADIDFVIFASAANRKLFSEAKAEQDEMAWQDSIDTLNAIEGEDAKSVPVLTHLGIAYSELEEYLVAVSFFDQALDVSPANERLMYSRGYRYKKLKKYDLALQDMMASLNIVDSYWETYDQLHQIHGAMGNHMAAINYATLGMKYREDDYFFDSRGWTYIDNNNPEMALHDFNKAISLKPENGDLWSGKARSLSNLGRYEEALIAINKALELNEQDRYDINLKASILDDLKQFAAAEKLYQQVLDELGGNETTYNNLGYAYIKQGKWDLALEIYQQGLAAGFDSVLIRNNMANVLFELKKYEAARAATRQSMAFAGNEHLSYEWTMMARIDLALGKYEEVFNWLKKVNSENPDFNDAYYTYIHGKPGNHYQSTVSELIKKTEVSGDEIIYIKAKRLQEAP